MPEFSRKIILASTSPRRSELLAQCGISHTIMKVDYDEIENSAAAPGGELGEWVEGLAMSKLAHARKYYDKADSILLCADTIVAIDGDVLGKPSCDDDARRMLRLLSGREHYVLTGVALEDTETARRVGFHERTVVEFRAIGDDEIDLYIASGEHRDKAGAYGIQGHAGAFVSRVDGCYSNVVGLPLSRLVSDLRKFKGQ